MLNKNSRTELLNLFFYHNCGISSFLNRFKKQHSVVTTGAARHIAAFNKDKDFGPVIVLKLFIISFLAGHSITTPKRDIFVGNPFIK